MKPLPDILEIKPLAKPPNCTITVPGSKSITNRALILAALADGKCTLRGALWADDTQVMVDSLQKLGFEVKVSPDPVEECNRTIEVVGQGGKIPAKKAELYVGNAGTAARFLTAFVCLGHGEYTIRGDTRMNERPMKELFDILRTLGAEIKATNDHLPATIHAKGLKGGKVTVTDEETSQFASALTLIGRKAQINVSMVGQTLDHLNYLAMTSDMVRTFKSNYKVEPDLSSASYFLAAGVITKGKVTISGWKRPMLQPDRRFPLYLRELPARVSRLADLGDSVMTLAICALFGKQPLQIVDATRLRVQETDRIKAMVTELKKVAANAAKETDDGFVVNPVALKDFRKADIETYNDHRMAMCFAVLGLKVPGIRIKNPSCVSKTFPNFFEKLEQLRQ